MYVLNQRCPGTRGPYYYLLFVQTWRRTTPFVISSNFLACLSNSSFKILAFTWGALAREIDQDVHQINRHWRFQVLWSTDGSEWLWPSFQRHHRSQWIWKVQHFGCNLFPSWDHQLNTCKLTSKQRDTRPLGCLYCYMIMKLYSVFFFRRFFGNSMQILAEILS